MRTKDAVAVIPRISMVMPAFNAEQWLEGAIGSLLSQTFRAWELVLVDNGSFDRTQAIAQTYAAEDSRIKIYTERTRGAWAARNLALEFAQGEYVGFLDADDLLPDSGVLAALYEAANSNGAKIVGGSKEVLLPDGTRQYSYEERNEGFVFYRNGLKAFSDYQFDYGFYRFIYSRQMLKEAGLIFPPYRRYEDPPFFVRAMIEAGSFYSLGRPTYLYRLGHQKTAWNTEEVSGLFAGLADNLRISRRQRLEKLHRLTVERLTTEYSGIMDMHAGSGVNAVQRAESHCLSSIDVSMLTSQEKKLLLEYYRQRQRRNAAADN